MSEHDIPSLTASSASVSDSPTEESRSISAVAASAGARFIGATTITREGDVVVVTGPRASEALYLMWYWACVLLLLTLLAWGFWWPGGSALPGLSLALALLAVWAGGLLLMGYRSQVRTVRLPLSTVRELSVGFRPRAWHVVLLLLTSGLAVVLFIPMYRNRHRTVSFLGDDGEGDPVRYRFETADASQAIRLAALLLK
jgi:hypothetical protein